MSVELISNAKIKVQNVKLWVRQRGLNKIMAKKENSMISKPKHTKRVLKSFDPTDEFDPIDEVVYISRGKYKGRIGYCDEIEDWKAIVYFGDMLMLGGYAVINEDYLIPVNTDILIKRQQEIWNEIALGGIKGGHKYRSNLLEEYILVADALTERMENAMFKEAIKQEGVFISYSSEDKQFATWLSVDLKNAGYDIWLDEWKIAVGESIPQSIQIGIDKCHFMIVVLSKESVKSNWVEREWQVKYWDEVKSGKIIVLPALIEKCPVPSLLRIKKYANFVDDYSIGLDQILMALRNLSDNFPCATIKTRRNNGRNKK